MYSKEIQGLIVKGTTDVFKAEYYTIVGKYDYSYICLVTEVNPEKEFIDKIKVNNVALVDSEWISQNLKVGNLHVDLLKELVNQLNSSWIDDNTLNAIHKLLSTEADTSNATIKKLDTIIAETNAVANTSKAKVTNLGKTREEIIYELVLSLNQGDVGYVTDSIGSADYRIELAIKQYDALVNAGIVVVIKE